VQRSFDRRSGASELRGGRHDDAAAQEYVLGVVTFADARSVRLVGIEMQLQQIVVRNAYGYVLG